MDVQLNNIVRKKEFREVQKETMDVISNALMCSFGPNASNTKITKVIGDKNAVCKYTKDGHTILKSINFDGFLEDSIRKDLEDITTNIVKNVGDGTTSAILLANEIFKHFSEMEDKEMPYEIIRKFKAAVEKIKVEIKKKAKLFTPEIAKKICMIATNGNEFVADTVKDIYEKYGNQVYIDVQASVNDNTYIKEYDGMTLNSGYSDAAYINNNKATSVINDAHIYIFEDPIDTTDMYQLFGLIINHNIMEPAQKSGKYIPTVILAPKISRDAGSTIENLISIMYKIPVGQKPPVVVISDIYEKEQLFDIARLCGCKTIKKYIDPKTKELDIKNGIAATPDNVCKFFGKAEQVEVDNAKTKIINPAKMYETNKETGERVHSAEFNSLIAFLEAELKKAKSEEEDAHEIGLLKRRLNSLKANLVELYIGGISIIDRDSLKDLVEDAVLSCRSAAENGYGWGANFEGLLASRELFFKSVEGCKEDSMLKLIYESYKNLVEKLYSTCISIEGGAKYDLELSMEKEHQPINLVTKQFDGTVLASINADVVVLDAISKIVTLMLTCNQFICPTPMYNKYLPQH